MTVDKPSNVNHWLWSAAILTVLVLGLTDAVDRGARAQLRDSFGDAMTTFVIVRGINAAISVFQGTEVALEPGGVGVVLTPGQIFDPVNDLIERFSWIVLAAGTSLGAQIILLNIGTSLLTKTALVLACITLLGSLWTPLLKGTLWRRILIKASMLVVVLRFLVPLVVLANQALYNVALRPTFESSFEVLEQVGRDVEELQQQEDNSVSVETDDGLLNSISRLYERTTQGMNISARYRAYEARVAEAAEQIINLIAVFLFQTVVFPLLFIWLGLRFARSLISSNFWIPPAVVSYRPPPSEQSPH